MATSAQTTYTAPVFQAGRNVGWGSFLWETVSGVPVAGVTTDPIIGWIERVDTIPGAVHPTNAYDITLKNDQGIDVLGGKGADRSSAVAQMITPLVGSAYGEVFVNSKLTLNVSGNTAAGALGTVKFFFRPHKHGTGR